MNGELGIWLIVILSMLGGVVCIVAGAAVVGFIARHVIDRVLAKAEEAGDKLKRVDEKVPFADNLRAVLVPDGACIIHYTYNEGWVLQQVSEGQLETFAFGEEEGKEGASKALQQLLWVAFSDHFRSKWRGGLEVEHFNEGRESAALAKEVKAHTLDEVRSQKGLEPVPVAFRPAPPPPPRPPNRQAEDV